MPVFIPGRQLCQQFFEHAVVPIIGSGFPKLKYAAGLIGSGSEVLGFDDEMSSDHHWGPRVMLFLDQRVLEDLQKDIDDAMRECLPVNFGGYSTNFSEPDPKDNNVRRLVSVTKGPVNHRVEMFSIEGYLYSYLGHDIEKEVRPADWLTFPEQKLRSIARGAIFRDEIGVKNILKRFSYYPHDVWLYLLASAWNRIGQEEHLMARAGFAGDEIGSALIAARLVRDIMRLCFLMEKEYAPYAKWFGTAFTALACSDRLSPHLASVLMSKSWRDREHHLLPAYTVIAEMHNDLKITPPLPTKPCDFFGRPFKVIEQNGGFSDAIREQIEDEDVRRIAANKLIGGIDQISDNTDILSDPKWRPTLRRLYE